MLDNSAREGMSIPIGHFLARPDFVWAVVKIKPCEDLRKIGDIVFLCRTEKQAKRVLHTREKSCYVVMLLRLQAD